MCGNNRLSSNTGLIFIKIVHYGICLRLAVANTLSYCICLIHEDRITRQIQTKAEIWKLFSSFGRIFKISHKTESFLCNYALILCVCLDFRLEIGQIKQVNAHLDCVCWWCKSGNPLRSVGWRMWSKDTQKSYMQKKKHIARMQMVDEGRENMQVTFKNPCKYGKGFINTCKPPQTHHEMGHICTTDKIINMLLQKNVYCLHGNPNAIIRSYLQ